MTTIKTPSLLITNDFISITINNKPFTIYKDDERFVKLKEVIKARSWDKLENLLDKPKVIAKYTSGKVQIVDGAILYDGKETNSTLAKKILEFYTEGYPFEPLVAFLDKLMSNPNARAIEFLYGYIEKYKLPICEDGDFIGYKAVTADLKDKYSKTIDNSLGKVIEMDRSQCVDDPNQACSKNGYHLGSFTSYVGSFANNDDNIIIVKVNPKDVTSLPYDSGAAKMQVCRYEVIKVMGPKSTVEEFKHLIADNAGTELPPENIEDNEYESESEAEYEQELQSEGSDIVQSAPPAPKIVEIAPVFTKVGQNRAYELYKGGKNVKRGEGKQYKIENKDSNLSRSYFRQYNDWFLVS